MQLGTFFANQKDGIIIYENPKILKESANVHESQNQLKQEIGSTEVKINFNNEKVNSSFGIEIMQNGENSADGLNKEIFTTDS